MKLNFTIAGDPQAVIADVDITACVVAGWAGRDQDAIEHHIQELIAIGVARPSAVPLYYRIASNQLIQDPKVDVVGPDSSGEAEVFIFSHQGQMLISLVSDHTDRKLEAHSVALSKQLCVKPVARDAWRYDEVAGHWDELILRSWIDENGQKVPYQDGKLASLLVPTELIQGHFGQKTMPAGAGMTCGTVATIGAIRPAAAFHMELFDPKLNRRITHSYSLNILPEIS